MTIEEFEWWFRNTLVVTYYDSSSTYEPIKHEMINLDHDVKHNWVIGDGKKDRLEKHKELVLDKINEVDLVEDRAVLIIRYSDYLP